MSKDVVAVTDRFHGHTGQIVYWRLSGGVGIGELRAVWDDLQLPEGWLPNNPTPLNALQRAMQIHCEEDCMIRTIQGGYAMVREREVDDEREPLEYHTRYAITINGNDTLDGPVPHEIQVEYTRQLQTLSASRIGDWLAVLIRAQFNAVNLRPSGGIYFVPRTSVKDWDRVKGALMAVSGHSIFAIPAMTSEEASVAVAEALREEARNALGSLSRELQSEKLGKRAIQTRIQRCEALIEKAGVYEENLQTSLQGVRDQATTLKRAFTAGLMAINKREE